VTQWSGAVAAARRLADDLMVDACTIVRTTGPGVQSEATGRISPTVVQVYAGRCQVRVPPFITPAEPESGGRSATLQTLVVKVPVTVEGIAVGDVVTVTAAAHDPELIGRPFRVEGIHHKTFATARKLAAVETTA
jgi:hypothetical protein